MTCSSVPPSIIYRSPDRRRFRQRFWSALLNLFASACAIVYQSSMPIAAAPPDTIPPAISNLSFKSGPTLLGLVTYNEAMDSASATNVGNYRFGPGVSVTQAVLGPVIDNTNTLTSSQTVTLSISGIPPNSTYSVTISGVKDLAGNSIVSTNLNGTVPFYEINWAMAGTATQSSSVDTGGGEAWRAIDGNTDGFFDDGSVTINAQAEDPGWWEVDLGATKPIGRLNIWFRTLTADECQALFNSCGVRNDDFTIQILDQNRNVLWKRTYPGRPPTSVPYNQAAALNGRFVRFESQTPLTTSDGFFSLAEVQVIAPYVGASVTVTKSPVSTTVTENQKAILGPVEAAITGAPAANAQYQWQKNGLDIVGANTPTYQTPILTLADDGAKYRCRVLLSGVSADSADATVKVSPDTDPPTIQSVVGDLTYTYLTVAFSEAVTPATAGTLTNYSLSGGLTISDVTILGPDSVRLTTSPQTPGTRYTLTVNKIRDLASGGGNLIAANSAKAFAAVTSLQDRFVRVANPGNPADPATGFGKVDAPYLISKYMVAINEYSAFLNAVATSTNNPHTLWDAQMLIDRAGENSYSYSVQPGVENHPISFVSAVAAMRYVNWLNNGGTASGDTETGAYTFTGETTFSARDPNANYFLPNENEYYKAAYYDPTKGGSGYWLYAVRTDDPDPTHASGLIAELPPGGAHSANFDNVAVSPDNSIGTTDVGAYTAASSYYGTFDQSGNQWEWIEPAVGATSTRRMGGSQGNNAARLAATVIATSAIDPVGATANQSFRIAKADRAVIKLVTVGNPGNHADVATGFGKVGYVYQIGQYMVKNSEYAAFLNAVATATNNPHTLWNSGMQIEQSGTDTYSYAVVAGAENRPINFVSALAAMRFCNWLHNGAAAGSDTETGAYAFTGETNFSARAGTAKFFLPTENEYYKAAYYDPTKGGSDYWLYAVRTDDPDPTHPSGLIAELPPGGAHSANFDNVAVTGDNSVGTTDVGAFTAASSYYGTFDQSGNQWEWIEPAVGATSSRRMGGSQGNNAARLAATVVATSAIDPSGATVNQSFRVAAPAIGSVVQAVLSIKKTGTEIQITWTGAGILQSAVALNNSWTAVPGAPSSPYVISNPKGTSFYRILQQ